MKKYSTSLIIQFSSVQSLSRVWLFVIPWTAAHQASLSITNCRSLLKPMFIESVMPSNHLILLLLPSIFPSIRVFSNESALSIRWPNYWSFSFSNCMQKVHFFFGAYFSFQKVKVLVAQSCLTLCDPMDCSPPGSSVHRILQARILG